MKRIDVDNSCAKLGLYLNQDKMGGFWDCLSRVMVENLDKAMVEESKSGAGAGAGSGSVADLSSLVDRAWSNQKEVFKAEVVKSGRDLYMGM